MKTKKTPFGIGLHFGITSNVYIRRNGKRIKSLRNQRNLILDSGMADIGERSLSNFQDYCHWGDDASANSLDSGAITASQSGTTVTASAGIFSAGDVGSLLKFDSGEEHYITTFNSSTEVVVDTSATVASSEFTIWRVDQTALVSEQQRTNSTQGTNNWSESAGVITRTRTHIFPVVGGSFTVREIGWGHENNANIGSRVVLGSPVNLTSGDQLEVESFFEVVQSPQTNTATDPTSDEGDFSGNFVIETAGIGSMEFRTGKIMEPGTFSGMIVPSNNNTALRSYSATSTPSSMSSNSGQDVDEGSYSNSSNPTSPPWKKTRTCTMSTAQYNGSISSIIYGSDNNSVTYSACRLLLTTPQVKSSDQSLSIVFSMTWDRNLTN